MEALGFNHKTTSKKNSIEAFINGSGILGIDDSIVARTIAIRKSRKIALPDAIIAATAIVFDLELLTTNLIDFTGIQGLRVTNPAAIG